MCAGLAVALVAVGQLAAQQTGGLPPHDAHDAGVEALDAVGAGVGFQLGNRCAAELLQIGMLVLAAALDLDDQRRVGVGLGNGAQHIGKQRRVLVAAGQRLGRELRPRHIVHKALGRSHAIQRIIVENHEPPVRGKLYIQLNAVAVLSCRGKGGQTVLRRALILAEEPAVGAVAAQKRRTQGVPPLARPDGEQRQNHQK